MQLLLLDAAPAAQVPHAGRALLAQHAVLQLVTASCWQLRHSSAEGTGSCAAAESPTLGED